MQPKTILLPLALVTLLAVPGSPLVPSADAGVIAIQPGDWVSTSVGECTLNFVFDGVGPLTGRVYMGTAGHCVSSVGQSASTTSYAGFGTVAFIGSSGEASRDYAFIEVRPDLESRVSAEMRGHPGTPTGFTTSSESGLGQLVRFSGYGLGFSVSAPTREERVGIIWADNAQTYTIEAPIIFGDSGGPILHQSGKAYGVVSQIVAGCCVGPGVYETGPTIERVLADSAARGFPVQLRTV